MTPKEAYQLSFKNKDNLIDDVSCYYCIRHFKASDINEWADKGLTALCPHCDIDSIIPGNVEDDTLIAIHTYWFKTYI